MRTALLLASIALSAQAHASVEIDTFQRLIADGNSKQAYAYALQHRGAYEGDPVFDYYYGVAAIDSGNASEGVFALERVIESQPDNHTARLELARGYFILEEYVRSKQEFTSVLDSEPPAAVRTNINQFLSAIKLREGRYTTVTSSYIELGLGTDSNVNSGPESANAFSQYVGFDPVFGTSSVSASSLKTDDSFTDLTANFNIDSPVAVGHSLSATATANLRSHADASEFDTSTLTLNGGYRYLKANNTLQAILILQKFNLDGDAYRDLIGITGSWKNRLNQQTTVNTALQLTQTDFPGQSYRNADTVTLSAGISSSFDISLSPVAYLNIYIASDSAEENSSNAMAKTERDYQGLRAGTVLNTSPGSSLNVSVAYQMGEYGAADTSLSTPLVREDDYLSFTLQYNWLLDRHWKFTGVLQNSSNTSNVDSGDYDRTIATLAARYEF